jgi:hypothetical protein
MAELPKDGAFGMLGRIVFRGKQEAASFLHDWNCCNIAHMT